MARAATRGESTWPGLARAGVVLLVWTALAAFFAVQKKVNFFYAGQDISWGQTLALSAVEWWGWCALTPFVVWFARRVPVPHRRLILHLALHILAAAALSFLKSNLEYQLAVRSEWLPDREPSFIKLHLGVLAYAGILLAIYAVDYSARLREQTTRAARLEAGLVRARLEALRGQLRPHFLFNTLNSIAALVRTNPNGAERVIARLGELLRASLDAGETPFVSLADELAMVRAYLEIQQTRYCDRLVVAALEPPPTLARARIPSMILQPLAENAIVHGLEPVEGGGARVDVRVNARARDGTLEVTVEDNGAGLRRDYEEGIGLANTRARLETVYGADASLTLSRDDACTRACVRVPLSFIDGGASS